METTNTPSLSADVQKENRNELIMNYLMLRKALGWMGIFLPIVLIIGSFVFSKGDIESSISNYFYTVQRDVFVVTLCAMSLFLFTYRGYDPHDRRVTNTAGILGFITAFVSTNFKQDITLPAYELVLKHAPHTPLPLEDVGGGLYKIIPSPHPEYLGFIHLACAASFFLCLAYMSYFQFGKTSSLSKRRIFRTCGIVIVVTILALVPFLFSDGLRTFYEQYSLIFWGEAICLWAFGISWLTKGKLFHKS